MVYAHDRQCRVILAYINPLRRTMSIQVSEILYFEEKDYCRSEEWKRLMCWVLATPKHNTAFRMPVY